MPAVTHPRHRRRHQRRAGRGRRRPTATVDARRTTGAFAAVDAGPGPRRVRRRRDGRRRARRRPGAALGRRRPGRRGRHRQPAGVDRSCGTARPASRSARASAGRTCAPSATASCCQAERHPRWRPNESATKLALAARPAPTRDRDRDLCFGTVDTWIAWTLSGGAAARHRRAPTPRVTGLRDRRRRRLGRPTCSRRCGIPAPMLPDASSTRSGVVGDGHRAARARRRSPASPATSRRRSSARAASRPGRAKITFGTGGMLDVVRRRRPARLRRAGASGGTLPDRRLAPRRRTSRGASRRSCSSAGTNVEWLRDDLGHHRHAGRRATTWPPRCDDTGGVVLRARPARPRHPALGLRRPRHAARPHPRARGRPADRAGRARGRRPPRRRPGRGGRGRQRHRHRRRCASTAA